MRYLLVSYVRKPTGQMDEQVTVSKRVRARDLQTCSVVLDFQKGEVVIASMNGTTIPRNFPKIRDFYQQHYKRLVEDLESLHGRFEILADATLVDTEPAKN